MGTPVVNGATITCSFGSKPAQLGVLPVGRVSADGQPVANINDVKPAVNIKPFGVCRSLANPVTASQTSAAMGTLTPGPCTPLTTAPWAPGSPTVMVAGAPALNAASKCACTYLGVIQITKPGARNKHVP